MFHDLLDQPRRETEALRAQCAAQEERIDSLTKTVAQDRIAFAAQLERISKLESMVVKCAIDSRTSIIALKSFGITPAELKVNGLHPRKHAGFTTYDYKQVGYTISELKQVGHSLKELKDAGFTLAEIWLAYLYERRCLSTNDLIQTFKEAGFTREELILNDPKHNLQHPY